MDADRLPPPSAGIQRRAEVILVYLPAVQAPAVVLVLRRGLPVDAAEVCVVGAELARLLCGLADAGASAIRDSLGALELEIRAGLHTGECEASDGKLAGIAVSIGARIASLAVPGEVLVSSTVKDLVAGSGLRFDDRGEHRLKGIEPPLQLFAVTPAASTG